MATSPIVPSVLGPSAERAIRDDVSGLRRRLERLAPEQWGRPVPLGDATVVDLVGHLAEGAGRLAHAWRSRVDVEADEALLHTFDEPGQRPEVDMDTSDPQAVLEAYVDATDALSSALRAVAEEDWSWPVWSPLGGLETLAEAARRWLAHHHVHRADIHGALGLPLEEHEDSVRLVVEFVLDALARRGGEAVSPPLIIEVVTSLPGAGTWSLIFDEPRERPEVESVFMEIVGSHPQALEEHRVERGTTTRERLTLRAPGDAVWRAAFGRGATFADLKVHGDDAAKAQWQALLDKVVEQVGRGLGRLAH